ncbi:uncharacterized protein LOC125444519 [Sphaerodactylus townsendi]|uniref:Uncharacterized protein n=1 Tax=Sphaerodactylus townsendi TaxID=933632 RepID=A0ACB8EXC5_9SAUR|nr:uncharacterized protein LOC125444519 [Sphaerodactylus townsendi]
MLDSQHRFWDTEKEEEEEEELSSPEDFSADSEESCGEDCQERGRGWWDPAIGHPLQRHTHELWRCRQGPDEWPDNGCFPGCTELRWDSGAETHPWGRESPPWDPPVRSWVQDTGAVCQCLWHLEQVAAASSWRLSHPSFQTVFTAVAVAADSSPFQTSPGDPMLPQAGGGPTPTMPPGCQVCSSSTSASSQQVLHSLRLNTPAPIVCSQPTASPGPRWPSDPECGALLALPAGARGEASAGLPPEAAGGGETGAPELC